MSLIKKILSKLSVSVDEYLTQKIESKVKEHLDKNNLALSSEKTMNLTDFDPTVMPTIMSSNRILIIQLKSLFDIVTSYSKTLTDETNKQQLNNALYKANANYKIISDKIINSIATDDDIVLFLLVVVLTLFNILEFIDPTVIINTGGGPLFAINQIFDRLLILQDSVLSNITYDNNKIPVSLIVLALACQDIGIYCYETINDDRDNYTFIKFTKGDQNSNVTGTELLKPKMFQLALDASLKANDFAFKTISTLKYITVQNANADPNADAEAEMNLKTPFDAIHFYNENFKSVDSLIKDWIIEVNNAVDATKSAKSASDAVVEANKAYESAKKSSTVIKDALKESTDSKNNEILSLFLHVFDIRNKINEFSSKVASTKTQASVAKGELDNAVKLAKDMSANLETVRKFATNDANSALDAATNNAPDAKDKLNAALGSAKTLISESNKVKLANNKVDELDSKYKALNAVLQNSSILASNYANQDISKIISIYNLFGLPAIINEQTTNLLNGYELSLKTVSDSKDINSSDNIFSQPFVDASKTLDDTIASSENMVSSANSILQIVSNSDSISAKSEVYKNFKNKVSEINKNIDNSTLIVTNANKILSDFNPNIEHTFINPGMDIYNKAMDDFKQSNPTASQSDITAVGVAAVKKFVEEKFMPEAFKAADAAVESAKKALDNANSSFAVASKLAADASEIARENQTHVITEVYTNAIVSIPYINTFIDDIVNAASKTDVADAVNLALNNHKKHQMDTTNFNGFSPLAIQYLLSAVHILLSNSTQISNNLQLNV